MESVSSSLPTLLRLKEYNGEEMEHLTDAPTFYIDNGSEFPEVLDERMRICIIGIVTPDERSG